MDSLFKQTINQTLNCPADNFDRLFNRAWADAQVAKNAVTGRYRIKFITGLAAGIMIGIAIAMFTVSHKKNTPRSENFLVLRNTENINTVKNSSYNYIKKPAPALKPSIPHSIRRVEWYHLSDDSGRQWLLEGYRRQKPEHAVYYPDM